MKRHHIATLTVAWSLLACSSDADGDDPSGSGGAGSGTGTTVSGPSTGVTGATNGSSTGTGGATPQGKPFFVIGGQDERHIVSGDGTAWSEDTYIAPNGLDQAYSGAAIGNGAVILSGDPGVLRSTDGHTWNKITLPGGSLHSSKVALGNGVFVLVAHADAYRSVDGLTWEHAADTGDSGHWYKVAFGGGHWVAIGDGHTKASEDGLSWHDYNATPEADPLQDVTYGNGVFVGVGKINDMARVATSPDGVNWTEQTPVPTSYMTGFGGVAFGDGKFVASDCCNAFESPDGVTWTKRGKGFQGGIAFVDGTFIAAGWRTEAAIYHADTGDFESTLSGDQPNMFDNAELAPWFTAVGAGLL